MIYKDRLEKENTLIKNARKRKNLWKKGADMNRATFEREMMKALTRITAGNKLDYWHGYQRGLRRAYQGEKFATGKEHEVWMGFADDPDESRQERGRGYLDGLKAE